MGVDGRFPSPGVDKRFEVPGVDWEHPNVVDDNRFPNPGEDTRFDNDGAGYGAGATIPNEDPPRVLPQRFTVLLPLTAGQFIGSVLATNSPTSYAMPLGNANLWWAIDSVTGVITVTAKGATELTAPDAMAPNVTATNAFGTSDPQPQLLSLV